MIASSKHGYVGPENTGDPHTICRCGLRFDSDRGLDVHIGRMGKLSSMVLNRREEVLAGKPE